MSNQLDRRWYDRKPNVSGLVRMVGVSPPEVHGTMGRSMSAIVKRDCKALVVNGSVRSLGSNRVLALYKSKSRQRTLDHNNDLFRAMNELLILPADQQDHIVVCSLELIDNIFKYLQICQEEQKIYSASEIEIIANQYIRFGQAHCQNFVSSFRAAVLSGEGADRLQSRTTRHADQDLGAQ
ncbi:MAG: hypothetical protein AB7P76_06375 [Candidatus Melainabacteria bacterium]